MKKVLLATAIAAMSTTAAMANVTISDYKIGKIHGLMETANTFEARGINIVENSNKIAVHKTVNAWNQGWNALEDDNTIDLDASISMLTIYSTQGTFTVAEDSVSIEGTAATFTNAIGTTYVIEASELTRPTDEFTISMRDSRAAEVSAVEGMSLSDSVGSVGDIVDEVVISISGTGVQLSAVDTFDEISSKVEHAVQNSYDAGFEDGYSAGYDDGFAAAKGVVKN